MIVTDDIDLLVVRLGNGAVVVVSRETPDDPWRIELAYFCDADYIAAGLQECPHVNESDIIGGLSIKIG
jgi:hypothetical protein